MRKGREPSTITPDMIREATDAYVSLIYERFPRSFPVEISWRLVAGGFMVRIAAALESLTLLYENGQYADARVALRVLYETVATFLWLGIDPAAHMEEWRDWADYELRVIHNDAKQYGITVLSPEELAELGDPRKPRSLPELTEAIDKFWPEHLDAFRPHPAEGPKQVLTFRGFYTTVFRKASALVHGRVDAIDRHMTARSTEVVVSHERPVRGDSPGLGVALTGFALLVYNRYFGWPGVERVREISDALMFEPEGPAASDFEQVDQ